MSFLARLPRALHTFALDVVAEARALAQPFHTLEVARDDARLLVVRTRWREVSVDRRTGLVKSGDRILARRGDIEAVELRLHRGRRDGPDTWSVRLRTGRWSTVAVGRSTDDVQASMVAARLGTATGRPVRAPGR